MTRLLLDEMLSPDIAALFRRRGHDAVAVSELPELRSTPDDELLAHATDDRRVLVTMNVRDFARIDATWKSRGRPTPDCCWCRPLPSPRTAGSWADSSGRSSEP